MMIDHWTWGYPISRQTQIMKHLHCVSNVRNPIPNDIKNYHDWGWLEPHPSKWWFWMVYDIGFTSLSNSGSWLPVEWWNSETWKLPTKTCSDVEIPAAVVVVWQTPKGERLEVDAKLTSSGFSGGRLPLDSRKGIAWFWSNLSKFSINQYQSSNAHIINHKYIYIYTHVYIYSMDWFEGKFTGKPHS